MQNFVVRAIIIDTHSQNFLGGGGGGSWRVWGGESSPLYPPVDETLTGVWANRLHCMNT